MTKFTFAQAEEGFDSHIDQSVRGYSNLWNDVLKFSEYFVEDGCSVVDIGCSTGKLLKSMKAQNDKFAPEVGYKGIEIEEDFHSELVDEEHLKFYKTDVRGFNWVTGAINNCLTTSIFSLQFMPKRNRQVIVERVYESLVKGGAFIFAEKIHSENSLVQEMMQFCYYDYKRQFYSAEELLDKEQNLRHMMKPLTLDETLGMCRAAGFEIVQPFWQNFNFVGVLCIKQAEGKWSTETK
jgi:tRNA (cmo5U34)-methyltransferase